MIPEAAVTAASKALMADKMSNHSGDNAPQIMYACEKVARKVLEAASPHIAAAAWDAGYLALADDTFRDQELRKRGGELEHPTVNPYMHDDTRGYGK